MNSVTHIRLFASYELRLAFWLGAIQFAIVVALGLSFGKSWPLWLDPFREAWFFLPGFVGSLWMPGLPGGSGPPAWLGFCVVFMGFCLNGLVLALPISTWKAVRAGDPIENPKSKIENPKWA
ncbi:MAG: hypothetical protein IT461_00430 [Planctomycetes bacterium]|nr:hypothetical protein [Planctomycetota bacterium]